MPTVRRWTWKNEDIRLSDSGSDGAKDYDGLVAMSRDAGGLNVYLVRKQSRRGAVPERWMRPPARCVRRDLQGSSVRKRSRETRCAKLRHAMRARAFLLLSLAPFGALRVLRAQQTCRE